MRRIALMLIAAGLFGLTATQAMAHGHNYHHHGPYRPAPVVVYRHGWAPPPPAVIVPAYPYAPHVRYRCYEPSPGFGFFYQGRGVSIGVGL